jgi:hypothetical protein
MKNLVKHLAVGILIPFLMGCSTGKNSNPTLTPENKAGLLNEFIIMAYSGPPLEEVTVERYQEIEEAGIEYLVPGNGTFNEEQNLRAMDLAQQAGFRIIPTDMRVLPFALKPDINVDTAVIHQVVESYKDHPAFAGYVVRDEPNSSMFPALAKITQAFLNLDSINEPLINLFPSYGSPIQLGFEDYRAYIRSFIEIVKPRLLAYDNYALREGVTWYEVWYNDLKIVREESREARIPFMVFVQSQGITEGLRVPTRADILWQVNTALAYGTHGVGWFSYWTPLPDQGLQQEEGAAQPLIESHYNAMIDINGNRTEVYDHVREANLYLKKAGRGLLEWDNQDVARYEAGALVEGSSPMATLSGDQANVVVGTFAKDQSIRLVISNASCEEAASFSLSLSPGWKTDKLFTSIAAKPAGNVNSLMEWYLEPGGSAIIDLIKTK